MRDSVFYVLAALFAVLALFSLAIEPELFRFQKVISAGFLIMYVAYWAITLALVMEMLGEDPNSKISDLIGPSIANFLVGILFIGGAVRLISRAFGL